MGCNNQTSRYRPLDRPRSLQIVAIIAACRSGEITQSDASQRLIDIDAPTEIINRFSRSSCREPRITSKVSAISSLESSPDTPEHFCLVAQRALSLSRIYDFHEAVMFHALTSAKADFSFENYNHPEGTIESLARLIGLKAVDPSELDACLCLADDRFNRSLFRSAGIAYAITHLLFPYLNQWTLWNWKRCIECTHPSLADKLVFIAHPS